MKCAAYLVAAVVLLVACDSGGPATPEPTSEPPTPTAVRATPTPPDPAVGRELQRNGQYEEAIQVYEQVIARGPEPERPPAQLSLAQTYLLSDRYPEARGELEALLAQTTSDSERQVATFLLAETLEAQGDDEQALDLYQRFAQTDDPAAPYAHLARARLLASLGRSQEAAQAANLALGAGFSPITRARALLDIARGFESGGTLDEAIAWYERLFNESESSADQALARQRIGALRHLRGDVDWADDDLAVIRGYPSVPAALDALDDLEGAGMDVDGYLAGVVYYRHFKNEEAQKTLESYLEQDPPGAHAAEAAYYLAAVYERRGKEDDALAAYEDSLSRDPNGSMADDAAWWRARLLEDMDRRQSAIAAYRDLAGQYPDSPWVADAYFRSGLLLYREKRYEEAVSAFGNARSAAEDTDGTQRARLWTAKALNAGGRSGEAMDILNGLAGEDPGGYYGLRAAALLGKPADSIRTGAVDVTGARAIDWAAIDAWAGRWVPSLSPSPALAFLNDARWARGDRLLELQLPDEASVELESLLDGYGTTSPALYSLTKAFASLGLTSLTARASSRLLAALPDAAAEAAPADLMRLAYPVDYASLVQSAADETGASPLLLLALIRQESFFDPRAGSAAGALGLTQIIPSTGEEIASDLGEEDFSSQDLYRPAVSILFGAQYLSEQLNEFDGRVAPALAAYNGGPGNAGRWLKAAGGDEDLFLEEIPFDQTQAYVKVVTENLNVYQALYDSSSATKPVLPR